MWRKCVYVISDVIAPPVKGLGVGWWPGFKSRLQHSDFSLHVHLSKGYKAFFPCRYNGRSIKLVTHPQLGSFHDMVLRQRGHFTFTLRIMVGLKMWLDVFEDSNFSYN